MVGSCPRLRRSNARSRRSRRPSSPRRSDHDDAVGGEASTASTGKPHAYRSGDNTSGRVGLLPYLSNARSVWLWRVRHVRRFGRSGCAPRGPGPLGYRGDRVAGARDLNKASPHAGSHTCGDGCLRVQPMISALVSLLVGVLLTIVVTRYYYNRVWSGSSTPPGPHSIGGSTFGWGRKAVCDFGRWVTPTAVDG